MARWNRIIALFSSVQLSDKLNQLFDFFTGVGADFGGFIEFDLTPYSTGKVLWRLQKAFLLQHVHVYTVLFCKKKSVIFSIHAQIISKTFQQVKFGCLFLFIYIDSLSKDRDVTWKKCHEILNMNQTILQLLRSHWEHRNVGLERPVSKVIDLICVLGRGEGVVCCRCFCDFCPGEMLFRQVWLLLSSRAYLSFKIWFVISSVTRSDACLGAFVIMNAILDHVPDLCTNQLVQASLVCLFLSFFFFYRNTLESNDSLVFSNRTRDPEYKSYHNIYCSFFNENAWHTFVCVDRSCVALLATIMSNSKT